MKASAETIISDEARRLAAVRRYEILDTPPDGAFDRVTAMAARRFGVPIAVVSIVDHDRIWFKSHHGLEISEVGRDPGLCASAILSAGPHILPDAKLDPAALANPLVAGDVGLRFYAGVPLTTHDGHNLGTLCVLDRQPHPIEQAQIDDLRDMASMVMDQMELRLSARRAVEQVQLMAREIDHRVMNSLQFISSLLTLQSRAPSFTDVSDHLAKAASRVAAVARVHRHFFHSGETQSVSCIDFLRRLCAGLSDIVGCRVDVEGDEDQVPSTSIQSIGLIVNELVTNAAKHNAERITVVFRAGDRAHELSVSDDGEGLPAAFDPNASHGLGMKVVTTLANQLSGTLVASPNPAGRGARFTILFARQRRAGSFVPPTAASPGGGSKFRPDRS